MSEQASQPGEPAPQPTGDAPGDVAGRVGEHVGRLAVLAVRRLEQMASASAAMAEQTMTRQMTAAQGMAAPATTAQPGTDERAAGEAGSPARDVPAPDVPAPDSATTRAEALVDGAGAQLGTLATLVSHQLRRAAALAREEAEDIWAEAQQIRETRRRDPDESQGRSIS